MDKCFKNAPILGATTLTIFLRASAGGEENRSGGRISSGHTEGKSQGRTENVSDWTCPRNVLDKPTLPWALQAIRGCHLLPLNPIASEMANETHNLVTFLLSSSL